MGQRIPALDPEKCRGCQACQVALACPIGSASLVDGKLSFGNDCNNCGRCIPACPFGATGAGRTGYQVYAGGRWGKKIAQGHALSRIFETEEEVLAVVEKAILLFREQGVTGERFADTIARIGFDTAEAELLSDDILARKPDILGAKMHLVGGASC